jgi:hypothetical protein
MAKTVNREITQGVIQSWGELVGASGSDITNPTYNTDSTVATYTTNGFPWALAYNADGTPNTETSGSLVKTYNYDTQGRFNGMTGAVNAGEVINCTVATLPANTLVAPGDRRFVTDVGRLVVLGTDLGNLGHTFEFVGATGSGFWMPMGAFDMDSRMGNPTTPVASLSGLVSTSTLMSGSTLTIPGGLLKVGMRFEVRTLYRKTGGTGAWSIIPKFGNANTTSDTSLVNVSPTAANNLVARIDIEFTVLSSSTMLANSTLSRQSEAEANQVLITGLNIANTLYFNSASNNIATGETLQLLSASLNIKR